MPLDESRQAIIRAALQSYRENVFTHNKSLLSVLVERINEQVPPEDSDPEAVQQAQLKVISDYFLGDMCHDDTIQNLVSSLQDLLSLSPASPLAKYFCLDGVAHTSVPNLDEVDKAWNRLRQDLQSYRTSSTDPEALTHPTDIPHDLEYLTTLVSSITKLSMSREVSRSITFFPPEQGFHGMHIFPTDEMDLFAHAFEGWTLTSAIQTGEPFPDWTPSGVLAVYCSKPSDGKAWRWRYGINGKYYSTELYDSIEDFLEFYAQFRKEESEEDVREAIVELDL